MDPFSSEGTWIEAPLLEAHSQHTAEDRNLHPGGIGLLRWFTQQDLSLSQDLLGTCRNRPCIEGGVSDETEDLPYS